MSCQLGKQKALSFNKSIFIASKSFELICSDVWRPASILSKGGSHYFIIFIDDYSHFTWIYLLKNRSKLSQIYQDFTAMIYTQFSKRNKFFCSDNIVEYDDSSFLKI